MHTPLNKHRPIREMAVNMSSTLLSDAKKVEDIIKSPVNFILMSALSRLYQREKLRQFL